MKASEGLVPLGRLTHIAMHAWKWTSVPCLNRISRLGCVSLLLRCPGKLSQTQMNVSYF